MPARSSSRKLASRTAGIVPLFLVAVLSCSPDRSSCDAAPSNDVAVHVSAPSVDNLDAARRYAGTRIVYYGDSVGMGSSLDRILSKRFTQDTGIEVVTIPRPKDATETYSTYQRLFHSRSGSVDVLTLDVIWPGALASYLADLRPELADAAREHLASAIDNNTIDGKLVAMPWFTDFGLLYYRSDLLHKYGFDGPPETWDDLERMALAIQSGERAHLPNFVGFVWQGKAYEGLTCNALEWFASQNAGRFIDSERPNVNTPQALKVLQRARSWIGTISPRAIASYEEEDARHVFQSGNAAFMRNWPYVYAAANVQGAAVAGKFGVGPLPHSAGEKSAGTLGGWQLGVSAFSNNKPAAVEFVRYMTSPSVQKYRALVGSFLPTIRSLIDDPDVQKAFPYLAKAQDMNLVSRPSNVTRNRYNEASIVFFQGVSLALLGEDSRERLEQMDRRLRRTLRGVTTKP